MDPIANPYSPGAGSQPHELAGRDEVREMVRVAIERVRLGRSAKSAMLVGLRGVGKTVLLDRLRTDAEAVNVLTARIEAPEGRSLPAMLAPQLRVALTKLSRVVAAKDAGVRALRALAGFARALKIKYNDIEVGIDYEPEAGIADNGDLEHDLQALFEAVGDAAKAAGTVFAMFIDELQYVAEEELAALITVMHRVSQRNLPVMLVGAGLPQLRGKMGEAKSYSERLFEFPDIGALREPFATAAIVNPAKEQGVYFEAEAVQLILENTKGYPYFIQEWGAHSWSSADVSPITKQDVVRASDTVVAAMDEGFFRVRFDRMTPTEKKYLRAMAELGPGPHRSGDIADLLGKKVQSTAPTRSAIIAKGMIWSPSHGDTAFTVPLFDEFMKRIMPGNDWK
jgi:Cdc6-like AAA superfamily ATPase